MSNKKNPLDELLAQAQKGDQESYKKFLEEIIPIIEKMIHFKIFNSSDVPDIVQITLLNIHKSLETYDKSKSALTWVKAIAHYKILDYIRKKSKLDEKEELTFDGDVTNFSSPENNTIEIPKILDQLPDKLREALVLVKIEGYSSKEAAQKLDIKEEAVRARVSRAIKQLKKIREKEEYYE